LTRNLEEEEEHKREGNRTKRGRMRKMYRELEKDRLKREYRKYSCIIR